MNTFTIKLHNKQSAALPLYRSQDYPWFLPEELDGPNDSRIQKYNLKAILGHRAACGLFSISDDYIEKFQSLDERAVRNKASTFFYNMTGDSMEPAIMKGDVLIVDKSIESLIGRIVIAHLDGEVLCKQLVSTHEGPILRSLNTNYSDIKITEEMNFKAIGAIIGIYRDYY